jgi:hypothetical protein
MPVRIEELDVVPQPQQPSEQQPPPTADTPSPQLAEQIAREIALMRARALRLEVR